MNEPLKIERLLESDFNVERCIGVAHDYAQGLDAAMQNSGAQCKEEQVVFLENFLMYAGNFTMKTLDAQTTYQIIGLLEAAVRGTAEITKH